MAEMKKIFAVIGLFALSFVCHADGTLFKVPTREGITTTLFWEAAPDAKATVVLLPGGGGGFGQVEDGKATSNNFLVRSEAFFVANGFNVAIFGRPNDSQDLDYADRISDTHLIDLHKVLAFVKQKADVPVWIVGTSQHANFVDCVRSRCLPAAHAEIGHRSASICHIGMIAALLGRKLRWDPTAERFVGDDTANRLLRREMRAPWVV